MATRCQQSTLDQRPRLGTMGLNICTFASLMAIGTSRSLRQRAPSCLSFMRVAHTPHHVSIPCKLERRCKRCSIPPPCARGRARSANLLQVLRLGASLTPPQHAVLLQIATLGCLVAEALPSEVQVLAEQLTQAPLNLCQILTFADERLPTHSLSRVGGGSRAPSVSVSRMQCLWLIADRWW